MTVRLRPATAFEWKELLKSSATDYALSHTFEFGQAIASAYPEYAFAPHLGEFEDGTIALWPLVRLRSKLRFVRRFEAMPPSLNGVPIAVRGELTRAHLATMISSLRADRLQVNGGILDNVPANLPTGNWEVLEQTTHVLDLRGGWNEVWATKFSKKVRNQCRKAWKKGMTVRTAEGLADFENYYQIYADSTRRWGYALPPYSLSLFRALASLNNQGVELKLGLVNSHAIAGIVLLHGRRSTLYWSGAMFEESANYSANNGLLEVAIREACVRSAALFDFGASGELDSVREFKEQFGAVRTGYQSLGRRNWCDRLLTAAVRQAPTSRLPQRGRAATG